MNIGSNNYGELPIQSNLSVASKSLIIYLVVLPLNITIKWKKQNIPIIALTKQTIINKKSVKLLSPLGSILFKLIIISKP